MRRFTLPKLYAITDARLSGLAHDEQLRRLSEGGATLVQLREKHAAPRDFQRGAQAAVSVARGRGVTVIVNDRADIALAIGADGVHLGQDDLDPAAARRLLGDDSVIGYSTHSLAQLERAALLPVDYVAFGPVFPTRTKENPDPVVGLELLKRAREALDPSIPLVAIGGVTRANARAALAAGADSVAVVSALLSEPAEIERRTREFLDDLG
ncbi:MAG: thiamine phosphate synthase [Acidobacteria bacterium]|nr:thiamine phosphate synthase [Acidobacteriota bacterium]MCA1642997.1 thiamine phosphate synthase [Acidobacteriota bacterium]